MDEELFERYEEREEQTRQLAVEGLEQQVELDQEEENEDPARVCWRNASCNNHECEFKFLPITKLI